MPIKKLKVSAFSLILISVLIVSFLRPVLAVSATIEVEEDEADMDAPPTPTVPAPRSENTRREDSKAREEPPKSEITLKQDKPVEDKPGSKMARVRINDKIGFYYFVSSGFLVPEESKVSSVGHVVGSFDNQVSYSTGKKTYIEVSSTKYGVKPGDLLIVYNTIYNVRESQSGFSGLYVRNLGIVKVLSVEKRRCQVEVKKTFYPFEAGDQVRFYDDELKRWKQAQVKKTLPDHPVKCYVAGGYPNMDNFNQPEFIFITAGSKKGVVEGQKFQLREVKPAGLWDPPILVERGIAQVFYTGPEYSLAQIITNNFPIQKGFEAIYQP